MSDYKSLSWIVPTYSRRPPVPSPLGRKLVRLEMDVKDNCLVVQVEGQDPFVLFDDGQDCCEHRYMKSDDVTADFIGATLVDVEIADGPTVYELTRYYELCSPTECQFLRVRTDVGDFVVANYNAHNGYYGGFCLVAAPLEANHELRR